MPATVDFLKSGWDFSGNAAHIAADVGTTIIVTPKKIQCIEIDEAHDVVFSKLYGTDFWGDFILKFELTIDKGAEVGTVVSTVELKAKKALILNSDGAWANYTVDFAAGTLDVIDQIRIHNPSGSANVRAVLVT